MALKFENIATIFSSFNPYPSLPPVATEDGKQFQCPNIVLNNKTGPGDGLPPMWPGFKSRRRRHMWVEFVIGSTPVFPSPQQPAFPNSNSTRNQLDEEPLCGCATSKSLFIYLFIYLFLSNSIDAKTLSSF